MLHLDKITHIYKTKVNIEVFVLDNISLSVKEGEIVSILGPSGCGKTTLINIIAGYILPTHGCVRVKEKEVFSPGKDRIVINQENDLFDWMTVYENMKLVCPDASIIEEHLRMANLWDARLMYPQELSGGMKKRLSLARALSVNPSFIVLDEPFGSLDYRMREKLQDMLLSSVDLYNKTVLLITHDIEEAVFLSDRVILLSDKPTKVIKEIKIPRTIPRDSEKFYLLKNKIRKELQILE